MRICLNMIVRNEARVIERCLRSVRPFIDSWAIADTGSTDGTQDIVCNFLDGLPGELIERPWVDFSTNRNEALTLARDYGHYALFIDADDVLDAEAGFRFGALTAPCYAIETLVGGVGSWVDALARLDIDWSWRGVLHEVLISSQDPKREKLSGVRLGKHGDGARSLIGRHEKYARDAEVLRTALNHEPGNTRYLFYLAHSLRESGQYSAAIDAYSRHVAAGDVDEEIYFSKLMIALLGEQVGFADAQIVEAYWEAYRFRPQRAEALSRLAHYHVKHRRYAQARACATAACAMPPTSDTILVDHGAWSWKPRDDLAMALLHLGDQAGCILTYRQMLADPQLPPHERERVQRNLDGLTQA